MGNKLGVISDPLLEEKYLREKDHILAELGPKLPYLNIVLDNELHKKLLRRANTFRLLHVRVVNGEMPRATLEELKPSLLKLYRRYYNVHKSGQMPAGEVRINPDPEYKNFYNRWKLIAQDFDRVTELDK
jgi:hypothetical protein